MRVRVGKRGDKVFLFLSLSERTSRLLLPIELPRDRQGRRGLSRAWRAVEEEVRELFFFFFKRG